MNILDRCGQIPVGECYTGDNFDFQRSCVEVIDAASTTKWGLTHQEKMLATLLRAWYDASSAASSSVSDDEVAEARNALKGANMARGRAEKRAEKLQEKVAELEDLVRELAGESD